MNNVIEIPNKQLEFIEIEELAKLTMSYTEKGFEELKKDIKNKGQLTPVVLRNKKVIDGRHRLQACKDLGIGMSAVELGNVDNKKVIDIIISNAITKDTNTDAAKVEAYLMCKAKGASNNDMPNVFSRLNSNYVSKLSFIEKENPKYLQALLEHKQVKMYNKQYEKIENYGTINGIWKTLKQNKALQDEVVVVDKEETDTPGYDVDIKTMFNDKVAENAYWDLYYVGKDEGVSLHPKSSLGKRIVELVKHKYLND